MLILCGNEHTRTQGRLLISREADAVCKGFPIGQVLHMASLDLDFPGVKGTFCSS